MDVKAALPLFYDDPNFMIDILRGLIEHMPGRLEAINQALASKDANALYRQAHNLKGISANFKAAPLTRVAAEIEALGKSEDLTYAAVLVKQLEIEAERLRLFCAEQFGI